ncbi:MAG TPA: TetR/AcrR family transcriptional regulator [Thermotogota bacterium]|nr:TetR/AcrR family transcriptional regulator [Thermotogota bacterium]
MVSEVFGGDTIKDLQQRILEEAVELIKGKGLSFTMSELAIRLGVSKKTLYEWFESKQALILEILETSRKSIKEQQALIYEDDTLSDTQKVRRLLTVVPRYHLAFDSNRMEELKKRYHEIYERLVHLFESDWEKTFKIMTSAMEKKEMKPVNLLLFKRIYINAVISLHDEFSFEKTNLSYQQALEEIISILFEGVIL